MSAHWGVRPVCPEEAEILTQIDRLGSTRPWSEAQIAAACLPGGRAERALLIESGSIIGGFVVFQVVVDEGSIHNLVVHPQYRRLGLGRKLLCAVTDTMAAAGNRRCLLDVRESNTAALALYLQEGFTLDGRRENYYCGDRGREAALLMSRKL